MEIFILALSFNPFLTPLPSSLSLHPSPPFIFIYLYIYICHCRVSYSFTADDPFLYSSVLIYLWTLSSSVLLPTYCFHQIFLTLFRSSHLLLLLHQHLITIIIQLYCYMSSHSCMNGGYSVWDWKNNWSHLSVEYFWSLLLYYYYFIPQLYPYISCKWRPLMVRSSHTLPPLCIRGRGVVSNCWLYYIYTKLCLASLNAFTAYCTSDVT